MPNLLLALELVTAVSLNSTEFVSPFPQGILQPVLQVIEATDVAQ